jgi:hypothetical protein
MKRRALKHRMIRGWVGWRRHHQSGPYYIHPGEMSRVEEEWEYKFGDWRL